ncbi:hypothetical protein LV79_004022 [Actinokineospora globicatena]|nr:hypothetical protein [Actinokineospora globicatena]GLW78323.1 hypothetical protein Aglo01_28050 [Actinokineospora globicatena]GLW85013.1 hypothetical protein Aglo02_26530 [Actinokineospora globicatena]
MSFVRRMTAGACAVLAVAGVSVLGAPTASAATERANGCVKVAVEYTRTSPVSWHVDWASVANNCSPFYGYFQLSGLTFDRRSQDSQSASGFTLTLNQDWGAMTTPQVCGIAWLKITPSYWAENGYVCVPLT